MSHRHSQSSRRKLAVLASLPLLALTLGISTPCAPTKHVSDTITFAEPEGADGSAEQTVKSGPADPALLVSIDIDVRSPDALSPEDVSVEVIMTCQYGTTKKFPLTLKTVEGSPDLDARFTRRANRGSDECIGVRGQREHVIWSIRFVRPEKTLQEVSFHYYMQYYPE